jgi:hypothetical protein
MMTIQELADLTQEQFEAEKLAKRQARLERRKKAQAVYQREWKWRKAGHENASQAHYDELLAAQNGRCAICGQEPKKKALAYHPKGLICTSCSVNLAWTKRNWSKMYHFLPLPDAPPVEGVDSNDYDW